MAEIILEGDWTPEQVDRVTQALRKSLSAESGGGAEVTVPTTIAGDWLSDRQRKLLKRWQSGDLDKAEDPDECGTPLDWDEYLGKGVGAIKVTPQGRYRMNANSRWERIGEGGPVEIGDFKFPARDGEYGRGVYLPVLPAPGDNIKLRAIVRVSQQSTITNAEFDDLAQDLTSDTDWVLDARGVRAIVVEQDQRVTQLVFRHADDIEPLGIIPNSGATPPGNFEYRIVAVDRQPDKIQVDIEMVSTETNSKILEKSAKTIARSTWQSNSYLNGTKLIKTSAPKLDRALVRHAIERCKLDGVPMDGIQVHCLSGVPDILPRMTHGFVLPSDGVVNLCPHDPQGAISYLGSQLADRLKPAVMAGAIDGVQAIDVLEKALKLSPEWWLELLIKRFVGAILLERRYSVIDKGMMPVAYRQNLSARGMQHWGTDRRRVLEAMAEDFRCKYDPAGLPNLVTMEWDLLLPNVANAGRNLINV